ncbi:trimethylamine methyltransferase family protein [Selenihalanaerobacter shriftii]|uniref:Methyltransferase n=1 Tax=Selenihalanaerobacter shriftii TaxID=142842 RepID=A0A1T4MQ75_9FIRM|nr:trimethylamine methyltransferase family protein [Selenihalanaerobacter shriftii]SJZ69123.1 trimethylamine---corrinoid protein Co-methyltransferase [Selenihalanaerobacter shriftii]
MIKGGVRGRHYKPFTDDDLRQLDDSIMHMLSETGVNVNSKQALEIFEENGAEVDYDEKMVKIPQSLVKECIEKAPSNVTLYGREEEHNLEIGENRVHYGTGGTVLDVLDLETGQKRRINIKDVADIAKLVDYLENIHFLVIPVYPQECDDQNVDVNRFYSALSNTSKHIMGGVYSIKGIREVIDMASKIAGSKEALVKKPFISFITCVMSPLVLDDTYTDFLIEIAKHGLPVAIPAEPLSGATGPITIAGNIALMAAESIAGVVLAQLVNPGTPVLFASTASAMDLNTALYITGEVEMGLMHAGVAQVAQYYGLPLYATAGMSDAKLPDVQAGYEKAMTTLLAGMSGANFIHDSAGLLEMCQTVAYEQYVIDNEIIGMAMRAIKGIEVNEETIATDVIERVGPGGHFLTDEHTRKHMRTEFFQPKVSDRLTREAWEEQGSKPTRERAIEMAKDILNDHQPLGIDEKLDKEIKKEFPHILLENNAGENAS